MEGTFECEDYVFILQFDLLSLVCLGVICFGNMVAFVRLQ